MEKEPYTAASLTRLQSLDFLRGLAVMLVLVSHWGALPGPFDCIARAGWTGVDLFFVLSGFLVSGLLFKEYQSAGKVRVWRFLGRRAWKIYPSFYVLLLTICALRLFKGRTLNPLSVIAEMFFFQNYYPGLQGHTWSLAVEEHFYILFALYIAFLASRRLPSPSTDPFRQLPKHVLFFAGVMLAIRLILIVWYGPNDFIHFFPTHVRADSLFIGVAIGYFYFLPEWRQRLTVWIKAHIRLTLAMIILCWLPAFTMARDSWFIQTVGFTLLATGFGLMILGAVTFADYSLPLGISQAVRGVAWVGLNSYSIYLWHFSVRADGVGLIRTLGGGWHLQFLTYILGSIGMGYLMALLIERPFLRLRDRVLPKAPIAKTVDGCDMIARTHAH